MISSNVVLTPDRLHQEIEYFGNQGEFVWDVETIDSQPGADDRGVPVRNVVTWVSMATHGRAIVIPMGHPIGTKVIGQTKEPRVDKNGKTRMFKVPVYEKPPEQLSRSEVMPELNRLFNDPDIVQGAHGATFDAATQAKYNDGHIPSGLIYCTLTARWITNENRRRYGLKYIAKDLYGFQYDDESVGRRVEKYPFNMVGHYAYCDAKVAWLEFLDTREEIERQGLQELWAVESELTSTLSYMRTTGTPIDYDRLLELKDELGIIKNEREAKVYQVLGRKINLNAPRQLQGALFKSKSEGGQGLTPWKLTDGGRKKVEEQGQKPDWTFYATDKEALETFKDKNEFVSSLFEFRETAKVYGTYVLGYLGDENDKEKPSRVFDGRIYPDFVQYGAATGRFSAREPNLQNVPAARTELGKMVRSLFVAAPGRKLIVADYGQVELVILAHLAYTETGKKGALWQGFHAGIDPHTMTAAMVLGKAPEDVTKNERQRFGKSLNFAVVYGAGAAKVASMAGVSVKEAKRLLQEYDHQFPEVAALRKLTLKEARSHSLKRDGLPPHSTTILGRMRRLPQLNSKEDGLRMYAERQIFNARVQGSSADLTKMAMNRFMRLKQDNWELHLTIHDELVVSAPDEEVESCKKVLLEAMTGPEMQKLLSVPLRADIDAADDWASAK